MSSIQPIGVRIALYEPDMPPNVGAIIRMAVCFGIPVDIIEPCGFAFSLRAVRRQVLDYGEDAVIAHHASFDAFEAAREGRLIALTTSGATAIWDFNFRPGDTLLMGRESAGLPEAVHAIADGRVVIPMAPGARSLNVAISAGIAVAEAQRQLRLPE